MNMTDIYKTKIIANELAKLFRILSHPIRIAIIKELRFKELDVQGLAQGLQISPSLASQHLKILKDIRLVSVRIAGKRRILSLSRSEIADWIITGAKFSTPGLIDTNSFNLAIEQIVCLLSSTQNKPLSESSYE
jgi:DNA-binding transcriptional ArsR family regulator